MRQQGDATPGGAPANAADTNLAAYFTPGGTVPLGVNLAFGVLPCAFQWSLDTVEPGAVQE